jgi:hypothetical protein
MKLWVTKSLTAPTVGSLERQLKIFDFSTVVFLEEIIPIKGTYRTRDTKK